MSDNSQSDASETAPPLDVGEVYAQHAEGLRRFVVGVLKDRDAAEDVVQVTFAKAVQAAGQVPAEGIKSWLYRVAFNEAITWKRKDEVQREASRQMLDRRDAADQQEPDEKLIRAEDVERMREALAQLSMAEQRVVRARMHEPKTFAQIALEMKLPLGTVLTHMRRALEKLRKTLKPRE